MAMKVEHIENYQDLGKALRLYDDVKEIIVTLDVGPRIMHISLLGKPSVIETQSSLTEALPDGKVWRIYGGHRTWHSPEAYPRSYMCDSEPLESYELLENGIKMVQKEEPWTQIKKSMEVYFEEDGGIRVVNNMTNNNAWTIEMAVWSLTVGSRGGREVCPLNQRNTGLQTNTGYRLWPYAKMNDPRIHWGQLYAVLDNDPNDSSAYKFGYANEDGWIAYFNHGQAFVKKFDYVRGAKYPDMGSSYQTYTSDWGVELETLSPLQFVKPGKTISQVETWYVVPSEGLPTYDDDEISKKLEPIAAAAGFKVPEPNNEPWDPTFEEED